MLVVDASVFVELAVRGPHAEAAGRAVRGHALVAPELFDVEVTSALKGWVRSGRLLEAAAAQALVSMVRAPILRMSHRPLLPEVWRLRHSLSAYDAFYVALARQIGAPVVTCDRRWAAAGDLGITVITVG